MGRKLGAVVLAVFLILSGLLTLTNLQFQQSGFVLGCLALAAGVLLLLDR